MARIGRQLSMLLPTHIGDGVPGRRGKGTGTFRETSFVGAPAITTLPEGTTLISQSTTGTRSPRGDDAVRRVL